MMATQLISEAPTKPRQFTLRDVMIWIGVLGFLWGVPNLFPFWTVGAILASVVYVGFILRRVTGWNLFRNVAVALALLFSGFYFLLTGFPFPVYRIERLRSPVTVNHVDNDVLQLADGRQVSLPLIKELPADDALFNIALQHGVEVNTNGDIYGLIEWPKFCGNDPTIYNLRRINLTELAAALHPTGLDDAVIPTAEITRLAVTPSMWGGRGRLPVDTLHEVRRVIEHHR
jgi:hypothetical protein